MRMGIYRLGDPSGDLGGHIGMPKIGSARITRQRLQQAREHWVGKHRDTDVLEHLIDRSHSDERRVQERRLQRELDEFAQLRPAPSQMAG